MLALYVNCTYGQEIPKKANVIVIKGVGFDQIVSKLEAAKYEFSSINKDNQTLRTKFMKICDDCKTAVSIRIRVLDSVASITGKWTMKGGFLTGLRDKIDDEEFLNEVKNAKGMDRDVFNFVNLLALSLNGTVSYKVVE